MKLTQIELAYAAGFFDGEGAVMTSVIQRKTKIGFLLCASASQNTKPVLDWFKRRFKGGVYGPNKQGVWQWKTNGKDAQAFLVLVLPYLQVKLPKAEEALRLWTQYRGS